jgi:LPXTG-site transpeptidase (sortase) family protein
VFKKGNVLIGLGMLLVLASVSYFLVSLQAHAASPFDLVDEGGDEGVLLPILVPAISAEAGEMAPTLPTDQGPAVEAREAEGGASEQSLVPDRLVIPAIFLDAPILPVHYKDIEFGGEVYHQWRVPAEFAAGWQDGSAPPGMPGNTVLNGHHNAYGMVFKDLVKLNEGDLILVHAGEVVFRYKVAAKLLLPERGQTLETRMDNARWLAPSSDERLTLVTCWPANSNTHRVILVAYPEGAWRVPTDLAPVGH